jgi:murein DD-endopeptidase MepM/ murein hydrolase activator NlpD
MSESFNKAQINRGILSAAHVTELVRYWQANHALVADGAAGPKTIASIEAELALPLGDLPPNRAWPLAKLADGRRPFVTSAYYTENKSRAEPDRRHYGVDLFYRYVAGDPEVKVGDGGASGRGGRPKWWIPPGTVALAAAAGKIHVAGRGRTGYRVWIDHGRGVYTGYFHLSGTFAEIQRGAQVAMGQPLGLVGDNPATYDAMHLHFEVYVGDLDAYPSRSVNPKLWLEGASILDATGKLESEPKTSDEPQVHSPT